MGYVNRICRSPSLPILYSLSLDIIRLVLLTINVLRLLLFFII